MKIEKTFYQKFIACLPICCNKNKKAKMIARERFNVQEANPAPKIKKVHRKLLSTDWVSFREVLKHKK